MRLKLPSGEVAELPTPDALDEVIASHEEQLAKVQTDLTFLRKTKRKFASLPIEPPARLET